MKKICFAVDAEGDLKMDDLLSRKAVIDAIHKNSCNTRRILYAVEALPSAQPDMAKNLYLYKCYITDKDGLQHEVIHTGDIRRVTGWEI